MITHGELYEVSNRDRIRSLGFTENSFYSLPYEFQKALISCGLERKKLIELRKIIALRQYIFEENVKGKVLRLLKKNK